MVTAWFSSSRGADRPKISGNESRSLEARSGQITLVPGASARAKFMIELTNTHSTRR